MFCYLHQAQGVICLFRLMQMPHTDTVSSWTRLFLSLIETKWNRTTQGNMVQVQVAVVQSCWSLCSNLFNSFQCLHVFSGFPMISLDLYDRPLIFFVMLESSLRWHIGAKMCQVSESSDAPTLASRGKSNQRKTADDNRLNRHSRSLSVKIQRPKLK